MGLRFDGDVLSWHDNQVPATQVHGFVERYGRWTGRAWLRVLGPEWRIPIDTHYAPRRQALREWFPDHPFESDWSDGRFPGQPLGLPPYTALALGLSLTLGLVLLASWVGLPQLAAVVGVLMSWPLVRLTHATVVTGEGMAAGAPWAELQPWYTLHQVVVKPGRFGSVVWLRGPGGGGLATLPTVLLPALRARVARLGGLQVVEGPRTLTDRYQRWRLAAGAVPWAVLMAGLAVSSQWPDPYAAASVTLFLTVVVALMAMLVEARATGWGALAVVWAMALYGLVGLGLGWALGWGLRAGWLPI